MLYPDGGQSGRKRDNNISSYGRREKHQGVTTGVIAMKPNEVPVRPENPNSLIAQVFPHAYVGPGGTDQIFQLLLFTLSTPIESPPVRAPPSWNRDFGVATCRRTIDRSDHCTYYALDSRPARRREYDDG